MPDDAQRGDDAQVNEQDLDRELADFEAELERAAGEVGNRLAASPAESDLSGDLLKLPTEEELHARFAQILSHAEAAMGGKHSGDFDSEESSGEMQPKIDRFRDLHPDLSERLDKLDSRVKEVQLARLGRKAAEQKRAIAESDSARGLGIGLTVAYAIVGVPMLGALIGWLLDSSQGTTKYTGPSVVIGAALGMAMGLFLISRASRGS